MDMDCGIVPSFGVGADGGQGNPEEDFRYSSGRFVADVG
jgi:hypothetical protein